MQEHPTFTHVSELARRLEKPIAVYDLEATTFRGRPTFGITEVACFVVYPQGKGVSFSSLINPERPISPEAQKLNGITPALVRDCETWGKKYAGLFRQIAAGQCYATGFNNSTFDNAAVKDMNERYGQPFDEFKYTFDIRRLHLKLSGAKSQAGTLESVAKVYGLTPDGNLHRAVADVALTTELLNAVLETYGVDAAVNLILPKPAGATAQLSTTAVAKYVRGKKALSLAEAAAAFKQDPRAVSFEIGAALDERLFDPAVFKAEPVVSWMHEVLPRLPENVFSSGKLKPIYEAFVQCNPPSGFDYIQLRIGLLEAGKRWNTLKPEIGR